MHTSWRTEVPQLIVVAGMLVAAAAAWPFAPDKIPVHWNIHGEIDRFGGRLEGLLSLPLIAAAVYVLTLLLPTIDPGRDNYDSFRTVYTVIRVSVLCVLAIAYACVQSTMFGYDVNVQAVLPVATGFLFMVLGNFMSKIRPNWFVGVRTPWTLSSRRSWNRTHRLAGWLFLVMGVVVVAYGFVQIAWLLAAGAAMFVVSVFWIVVYSYVIWRDDPDRFSPAGTSPSSHGGEPG